MLNFTVGPVMLSEPVLSVGAEQVPYFRTEEFSEIILESEGLIKEFARASESGRVVFITGSGSASMEAAVINTLTESDKALVVNGGSFGQRFVQICEIHGIPFNEIKLEVGQPLTAEMLEPFEGMGFTAFIVNVHETSTGVHYDMELISEFCRRNALFLIVDAISSFLADNFDMYNLGVDVMITSSQKALACPPGVSLIVLSERALNRVEHCDPKCLYLDLKSALKNAERGQTPFTPAVGILRQLHARLKEIKANGGAEAEIERIAALANDFRCRLGGLPLDICSKSLSNAVTPLATRNCSAYDVFLTLKNEYGIWICPNGGDLRDKIFRVGHIGALRIEDNEVLIKALFDLKRRGILK